MGDEAEYLEAWAWGELAAEECEEERRAEFAEIYDKYIEDLKYNRVSIARGIYIQSEDLLHIAQYRWEHNMYNSQYKASALRILRDGKVYTEGQRRCLYGFIRLDKKESKKSTAKKAERQTQVKKKAKRAIFILEED